MTSAVANPESGGRGLDYGRSGHGNETYLLFLCCCAASETSGRGEAKMPGLDLEEAPVCSFKEMFNSHPVNWSFGKAKKRDKDRLREFS